MSLGTALGGMPPAVEAALRSLIGSVPGVSIHGFTQKPSTTQDTMGLAAVTVVLSGWSPSLNRIAMTWNATNRRFLDHAGQIEILGNQLADRIARQRRRAAEGVELGTATPFDGPDPERPPVGHVLMDRGLADLVSSRGSDRSGHVRQWVAQAVRQLHELSHDSTSDHLSNDDLLEGRVLSAMMPVGDDAYYWGNRLWVRAEDLPETVRIAAIGRRLGEIATVPACIADHIVSSVAAADDEGTDIGVEPMLMTIDEIERTRMHERLIISMPKSRMVEPPPGEEKRT